MSATCPCDKKKFYIYSDGTHAHTHTHTVRQANACLTRFTTKAPVIIPANIISSTKSHQLERGRSVFKLRLPRTIFPKLKGRAWRPPSGKNLPSHGLSGQSVAALWGHCNVGEELLMQNNHNWILSWTTTAPIFLHKIGCNKIAADSTKLHQKSESEIPSLPAGVLLKRIWHLGLADPMGTATVKAPLGLVTVAARSGTVTWLKARKTQHPELWWFPTFLENPTWKKVKPTTNPFFLCQN